MFLHIKKIKQKLLSSLIILPFLFLYQNCASNLGSENLSPIECLNGDCTGEESVGDLSCAFDGDKIANGSVINAYLHSTSETCTEKEERTCSSGELSGSYEYVNCSTLPNAKKSCLFNKKSILHSMQTVAYRSSTVPSNQSCDSVKEFRTCDDSDLSGSYEFPSCKVSAPESCRFEDEVIADSEFKFTYERSSVVSPAVCKSQKRICTNGKLSGSYAFGSCNVDMPQSCSFGGKTIPHLGTANAYLTSSVPNGEMCSRQIRKCDDGVMSGSYKFSTCVVNKPRSCLFDEKTIPNGGDVYAYFRSQESYRASNPCRVEQRRCSDGDLSGTAEFSSCKIVYPTCNYGSHELDQMEGIITDVVIQSAISWYPVKTFSQISNNNNYRCSYIVKKCNKGKMYTGMDYTLDADVRNKCRNPLMGEPIRVSGNMTNYIIIKDLSGKELPKRSYKFDGVFPK